MDRDHRSAYILKLYSGRNNRNYFKDAIMAKKPTYLEMEQRVKELEKEVAKLSHTANELQSLDAEKKAILNSTIELVAYLDTDLKIVWTNKSADKSVGLNAEDLVGRYCYEIWGDGSTPCADCPGLKAIQTGQYQASEISSVDGGIWLHMGSPVYRGDNIVGVVTTALDITDRKQAEKALRESEEKYKTQFEEALDAIIVSEAETGILVDCNHAASVLVGRAKSEIIGKHQRILHPSEAVEGEFSMTYTKHLGNKEGQVLETQIITKDGEIREVAIKANLFEIKGKRFMQGIFRDITERKRSEKALQEREAELESKSIHLQEVNTALKVLLKQREEDRSDLEEKVLSNVKQLVSPHLQRLKHSGLDTNQKPLVSILESNLDNIISPFTSKLSSKSAGLTPMEIRTADLVKEGKTNKEIGDILCLSPNTVKFHRYNLRAKLGLKNKKINLRSHLLSLLK